MFIVQALAAHPESVTDFETGPGVPSRVRALAGTLKHDKQLQGKDQIREFDYRLDDLDRRITKDVAPRIDQGQLGNLVVIVTKNAWQD